MKTQDWNALMRSMDPSADLPVSDRFDRLKAEDALLREIQLELQLGNSPQRREAFVLWERLGRSAEYVRDRADHVEQELYTDEMCQESQRRNDAAFEKLKAEVRRNN